VGVSAVAAKRGRLATSPWASSGVVAVVLAAAAEQANGRGKKGEVEVGERRACRPGGASRDDAGSSRAGGRAARLLAPPRRARAVIFVVCWSQAVRETCASGLAGGVVAVLLSKPQRAGVSGEVEGRVCQQGSRDTVWCGSNKERLRVVTVAPEADADADGRRPVVASLSKSPIRQIGTSPSPLLLIPTLSTHKQPALPPTLPCPLSHEPDRHTAHPLGELPPSLCKTSHIFLHPAPIVPLDATIDPAVAH